MNLTLVTATGDRPEAFALCEKYMDRQTRKDAICQWIVLDDGDVPTNCTKGQDLARNIEWKGFNSLANKVRYLLEGRMTQGDVLVFIEDDDWYHPEYLATVIKRMEEGHDLIGEGDALYYNVEMRWWCTHNNKEHASLCQTAIRKTMLPHLLKHVIDDPNPFIDSRIWQWNTIKKKVFMPDPKIGRTCIGIKSMPGRKGYGVGHTANRTGRHAQRPVNDDQSLVKLQELIGNDAEVYAQYAFKKPEQMNAALIENIAHTETGRARGPQWLKWLGHLKGQRISGMELGTFQGESAEWFCDNIVTHAESRFTCIDTFEGSAEHKLKGIDCTKNEALALERLARFRPRVAIHKGMSHDLMRDLDIFEFDFIYVDADHSARGVMRDAVYAFDLLKVGGIMVFDDYAWNVLPDPRDCPKLGIDNFINAYIKHLTILTPVGWQIAIRKESQ